MILELLLGSLSYHPAIDSRLSRRFENKVSSDGRLISNPTIGVRGVENHGRHYRSAAVFAGNNSVGAPIAGILVSTGITRPIMGASVNAGLALGSYHQDPKPFKDRKLNAPHPFVPAGGVELIFRKCHKELCISFNNLINPLLTNHSLGIGYAI